ncbi:hypothetical protein [Planctomicrobium sp. SH527]|uniref:hypothetical protein n=1 Tax=Planctomicrobium sp. SH527 TaxID=3448123 RepID=UPI003F5C0FA0
MKQIEHTPEATLKATQIIALALIAGIVSTCGIVVFLGQNDLIRIPPTGNLISLVMVGLTALGLIVLTFLSMLPAPEKAEPANLPSIWQGRMVVRFILLEGAALLNAVAYVVELQWWSLAVLVGVFALMLVLFPTKARFDRFLKSHPSATF